jgi:hypothetical protein
LQGLREGVPIPEHVADRSYVLLDLLDGGLLLSVALMLLTPPCIDAVELDGSTFQLLEIDTNIRFRLSAVNRGTRMNISFIVTPPLRYIPPRLHIGEEN